VFFYLRAEERKKFQMEKVRPPKPEQPSNALINMEQTLLERRAERRRLEQQVLLFALLNYMELYIVTNL